MKKFKIGLSLFLVIALIFCTIPIFSVSAQGVTKISGITDGGIYTKDTEDQIIELLNRDYIRGLSLLGGEPMEPQNQAVIVNLIRRVKKELPTKDIWCYSGYTFDRDLVAGGRAHTEFTDEILNALDVLVDGRFVEELKNLRLKFRGSSNQRVIDVKNSLLNHTIVLMEQ